MDTIHFAKAEVAELADALGSGLSSCKGVRVQVPPSALKKLAVMRVFYLILFIIPWPAGGKISV